MVPRPTATGAITCGTPTTGQATPCALRLVPDDHGQVARIRAGNAAAFAALFHAHYVGLHAFAKRYAGSDHAADEVVQEVFFTLWLQHETWAPRTTVASYLYAAVRNRALNLVRHDAVISRHAADATRAAADAPTPWHAASVDTLHTAHELDAQIRRTLDHLPDTCRLVFTMNREHGLSYTEIAEVLNISPRTVEHHIGRALIAFRRNLRDWLP